MVINDFFKKEYTRQEIEECFEWFESHIDELPESLSLSKEMKIPNLKFTVSMMISKLRPQMKGKDIFNGQFANLLFIRNEIEKQQN